MPARKSRGRKPNATGRSNTDRFVRLPHLILNSCAYSCTMGARATSRNWPGFCRLASAPGYRSGGWQSENKFWSKIETRPIGRAPSYGLWSKHSWDFAVDPFQNCQCQLLLKADLADAVGLGLGSQCAKDGFACFSSDLLRFKELFSRPTRESDRRAPAHPSLSSPASGCPTDCSGTAPRSPCP